MEHGSRSQRSPGNASTGGCAEPRSTRWGQDYMSAQLYNPPQYESYYIPLKPHLVQSQFWRVTRQCSVKPHSWGILSKSIWLGTWSPVLEKLAAQRSRWHAFVHLLAFGSLAEVIS